MNIKRVHIEKYKFRKKYQKRMSAALFLYTAYCKIEIPYKYLHLFCGVCEYKMDSLPSQRC